MRQHSLALNPTVQPQSLRGDIVGFPGRAATVILQKLQVRGEAVCWVIRWLSCTHCMLGCTMWACRPLCSCPASRPRGRDSGTETADLTSQRQRVPGHTALCEGQGMVANRDYSRRRRLPFIGGSDVRWAGQLPRVIIKPYN